ncbi:MAG: hypothetical protein IH969_02570, partial [Candidatus Krumholzibacteriota bacterium]|nr:hypothetical protein [Candidatus Krumholzibacteriota bacterium]
STATQSMGEQRFLGRGQHKRVIGKNMTDPDWGADFARKYVEACKHWKITPQPSYNCKIACAYDVEITDGPYKGFTGSKCGGGEPMEGAGSIIGVDDPVAVVIMNDVYDSLGIEMGQFAPMLGVVYEAYNEGLLDQQDTGGLDFTWGNWESAMEVINQAVNREGFGAKFVDGPKAFIEAVGAEKGIAEELRNKIIDMKGGGAVMHDHRGAWSAFFCEMTAGYGASTQGRGTDTFLRRDLGYDKVTPGVATNLEEAVGKVEGVYRTQIIKLFWDSLGICTFGTMGVAGSVGFTSKSVAQAVGWEDFDEDEAFTVGERISNMLRLVYARRGFKREDELDLSPRFLEITRFGPAEEEGIALSPYADRILDMAGLFPLFLQIACSNVFEFLMQNPDGDPNWVEIERAYMDEADQHYRFIWEGMGSAARINLRRVAEGKSINRRYAFINEDLERRGYLVESELGPGLCSDSFRGFVVRQDKPPSGFFRKLGRRS